MSNAYKGLSGTGSDERFTPAYAVEPLIPYLTSLVSCNQSASPFVFWEPCDTYHNSAISDVLRKVGFVVKSTSKDEIDFLTQCPDFNFNAIITNPPYSLKEEFISRCYFYSCPWAMLMPITTLEGIERGSLFCQYGIEVLVFDRRIQFDAHKSTPVNTSWFTHGILPQQLIFQSLNTSKCS